MPTNRIIMVTLWNRADHYIFILWFLLLFSWPNLSRRRLDVCHTSTHGVALVRIWDAGLKRAARGSLKIQDAKKSPKIAIWAPSHKFIGLYLRNWGTHRQSEKLVKQQYVLQMSPQYGELRLPSGWDRFGSLGHPYKFQRVSRLDSVTARYSSSGRQPNCGVEQRTPPIFGRATMTLALAHTLVLTAE